MQFGICVSIMCMCVPPFSIILVAVDGIASTSIKITLPAQFTDILNRVWNIKVTCCCCFCIYCMVQTCKLYLLPCNDFISFVSSLSLTLDLASFSFNWRSRKKTHVILSIVMTVCVRAHFERYEKILRVLTFFRSSYTFCHLLSFYLCMSIFIAKDVNNMDLHIKCNCVNCNSLCCIYCHWRWLVGFYDSLLPFRYFARAYTYP